MPLLIFIAACAPSSGDDFGACGRPDLAFAGDVLLHSLIQSEAAARPEGFAPAFASIEPALSRASLKIVNLEGPTAGNISPSGQRVAEIGTRFDDFVYAGYPRFNYHPSIAATLWAAGVDVVQTGNNHAMDRGPLGVDLTLEALSRAGLATTGTRSQDGAGAWHVTQRVSGRNVAFLSCTFSINGLPDSGNQAVGCYVNSPSIPAPIQSLVAAPNIDTVVLLPHWGTEFSSRPSVRQRRLAQAAAEAGASAIVGLHPHVLQPIELLTTADSRRVPVAYSLGNLISTQWRLEKRTGAILYLDLATNETGHIVAENRHYLPTRVERATGLGVTVYPAAQVASGVASSAFAQRILGPGVVAPDGCTPR